MWQFIFGAHAPDVSRVLGDEATHGKFRILGAFQYVQSNMYLQSDESLMPWNPSAWSACNFLGTTSTREVQCFNSAAWFSVVEILSTDYVFISYCKYMTTIKIRESQSSVCVAAPWIVLLT